MSEQAVLEVATRVLPKDLCLAQDAINRPEVQEMLKKLAQFNLGIYMPHRHAPGSGAFEVLPEGISQVEAGLRVTFEPTEEVAKAGENLIAVGWVWAEGGKTPLSYCRSYCRTRPGDTGHYDEHVNEP